MNKPFYKSTGVMGAGASIVGCVVALVASLASLKGLEITSENQALIVSLVMTLGGGVAALIGRLKASDVIGADIITGEAAIALNDNFIRSLSEIRQGPHPERLSPPLPRPASPEDEECPACHGKFGAHFLNCPAAGAASRKQSEPRLVDAYQVIGVAEKFRSEVPLNAEDLDTIRQFLKAIGGSPYFVKDQAGCPSKDPAPMAEGQLVGDQSTTVVNG